VSILVKETMSSRFMVRVPLVGSVGSVEFVGGDGPRRFSGACEHERLVKQGSGSVRVAGAQCSESEHDISELKGVNVAGARWGFALNRSHSAASHRLKRSELVLRISPRRSSSAIAASWRTGVPRHSQHTWVEVSPGRFRMASKTKASTSA
jgi:hypothetical protein